MKPLYSIKGQESDHCYELEYFHAMLRDGFGPGIFENVNQLELEEWKANIPGDGTFWCKEDGEAYESSESYCGIQCHAYSPRNGKSGRCRWHSAAYSPTGKTVVIKKSKS